VLHGCPHRNQSNIASLLTWITTNRPVGADKIYALELGNELNSCLNGATGAQTQAADFVALKKLVDAAWPSTAAAATPAPLLIGPDTHSSTEYSTEGVDWFKEFVETAGSTVAFNTFHMYSLGNGPKLDPTKLDASFLSTASLDNCGKGVKALQLALPASRRGLLWAGETAAANDGGQSGITDTFIDGFWYLDQLGQLATFNVTVFLRQTMLSEGGLVFFFPHLDSFVTNPSCIGEPSCTGKPSASIMLSCAPVILLTD
jgi:heparanase 1